MSAKKLQIRQAFRDACFKRDGYKCVACGFPSSKEKAESELDCHHVCDRHFLNGGTVKENGISLCFICHEKAEEFHRTGVARSGYSPEDLYKLIGSSYALAQEASIKFGK